MKTTADILETNKKQKEFYNHVQQNFFTKIWASLRNGILNKTRKSIGVHDQSYALHMQWFGDLSEKKVLDLGCFSGNHWSFHLAANAKEYLGIDLSDVAIGKLSEKLQPYPNAKAIAVDFLSPDFAEKNYDLIYAYGVLHHFESMPILIEKLNEKLAPNGEIISYDPMETSWPIKFIRALYRPFQSDAAWEWPFSKKTYFSLSKAFDIIDKRGILGKSKWAIFVNFMPISDERKQIISQKWHNEDWEKSQTSDKALFRCMHLTMLLRKKTTDG
ncbi:MAG: class I SAM-dependent methyltransferase [Flavobacterium sp.]|nr:class I SAM-dependent methyltransferase [Flavobacterium sp.]